MGSLKVSDKDSSKLVRYGSSIAFGMLIYGFAFDEMSRKKFFKMVEYSCLRSIPFEFLGT